jgi:hypothetical protein
MKRQAVRTNPKTGEIEHYYEDCGPSAAVAGHGRPVLLFGSRPWSASTGRNAGPGLSGTMQLRLHPSA